MPPESLILNQCQYSLVWWGSGSSCQKGHLLNDLFLGSYKDHPGQILDEDVVGSGNGNNASYSIEDIDIMHLEFEKVLMDTFKNIHLASRMDQSIQAGRSGTTCVVCIVDTHSAKIYTHNVGD